MPSPKALHLLSQQKKMIETSFFRLTSSKEMGELFKCIIVSDFDIYDESNEMEGKGIDVSDAEAVLKYLKDTYGL